MTFSKHQSDIETDERQKNDARPPERPNPHAPRKKPNHIYDMTDVPILPKVPLSPHERIEICIPSRGRTANLITLLQALRDQRFVRWDLTILDDNPDDSLETDPSLEKMVMLTEMAGHRTRIIKGASAGLIPAQNTLLAATRKNLIARIDDDTLPDGIDYLEQLVDAMLNDRTGRLGAVGGPIADVRSPSLDDHRLPPEEELDKYYPFESPHIRYVQPKDAVPRTVPSLYSSFLYKRPVAWAAGGFSMSYSPIAEKEDTDLLVRMGMLGATCLFLPRAQLWHLKAPMGGIRFLSERERAALFQQDYLNFVSRVKQLRAETFDWAAESAANLSPFQRFTALDDSTRGYIDLSPPNKEDNHPGS